MDVTGSAYVTGSAGPGFPATPGAFDATYNGGHDAFVVKVVPAGNAVEYATYLGGAVGDDYGYGIAVDGAGSAYVTGDTGSSDFPTTSGAFDRTYNVSLFVTKLDPSGSTLAYSTYLDGTNGSSFGYGIAVDGSGSAYVTGRTFASNFPMTSGAFDTSYNGNGDVFVTKLAPSGNTLVYSTYLGGGFDQRGNGIAVDGSGNAYVTGVTGPQFPTTSGAFNTTGGGAFVTKLAPSGGSLAYSTYLGGSSGASSYGIAVDGNGSAYVTGSTSSLDFPTTSGAFGGGYSLDSSLFVTSFSPDAASLQFSGVQRGRQYGGSESGLRVAASSDGSAYLVGSTVSVDFPTTSAAFDTSTNGGTDVFVTKLEPLGGALAYSTYLGGTFGDVGYGIAVDATGSAYITGSTHSGNFPTTSGAFDTSNTCGVIGCSSPIAFVTKLDASGGALAYSTFLGGIGTSLALSIGYGIAVDWSGSAYVTGHTLAQFPTTSGAFDTTGGGTFVTKLAPSGGSLAYSTFLGSIGDRGYGIAVDGNGSAYVTGNAYSLDFPTTAGAFDTTHNGRGSTFGDAFVTKVAPSGSTLDYSTYLGGAGDDVGYGIAVDGIGGAYVTGHTLSVDFPTTSGAFDTSYSATSGFLGDAFVTKVAPIGSALEVQHVSRRSQERRRLRHRGGRKRERVCDGLHQLVGFPDNERCLRHQLRFRWRCLREQGRTVGEYAHLQHLSWRVLGGSRLWHRRRRERRYVCGGPHLLLELRDDERGLRHRLRNRSAGLRR